MPMSLALYALATRIAAPLAPALLRRRMARGKEDPARLGERLGRAGLPRPEGVLVWFHGASVGEALSLLSLIEAVKAARPEVSVLVTSGTVTSAALMAQRLPAGAAHQYIPIDTEAATAAFLDHWRPNVGVFVESELWPNLLLGAQARGVRMALLSARLSMRSFQNWKRLRAAAASLYGVFDLILAQSEAAALYIKALGGRVAGLGDLKFGAAPLPCDEAALAARRAELGGRPVILAASTHPGEDEIVLEAFQAVRSDPSRPLLVIVPRHPERGPAIAELAAASGLRVAREQAGQSIGDADVLVADRLGELGLWYRLARLAFIGGSLKPGVGGHNPLEPARLGTPFVFGHHVDNWKGIYDELWEAGAASDVNGAYPLSTDMRIALDGDVEMAEGAQKALAYVQAGDAAARAIPAQVLALIP